jgi:hypothetical protein
MARKGWSCARTNNAGSIERDGEDNPKANDSKPPSQSVGTKLPFAVGRESADSVGRTPPDPHRATKSTSEEKTRRGAPCSGTHTHIFIFIFLTNGPKFDGRERPQQDCGSVVYFARRLILSLCPTV